MATNHGCFSLKLQVADMLLQSHLMQNPEVWVESPVIKCGGPSQWLPCLDSSFLLSPISLSGVMSPETTGLRPLMLLSSIH